MPRDERNPDELGALWLKQSARGDYMTGEIGGVKVVCFPNTRKTSDRQPDWRVLKSKPRTERPAPAMDDFPQADDDIGF